MVMLTAVMALSACGGGGGGSDDATASPAPAPATPAPPAPSPSTPTPPAPAPATPAPPAPAPVRASDLQGRWLPSSSAPGYTLIVLPAASDSAQAWALAQDGSALAKLSISSASTTLAMTGSAYTLNSVTQAVSPLRGTATAALSSNTKTLSLTGLASNQLDFTQSDALTLPALQSDLSANWRASFNQGSQVVNWTIASSGAVSGTSNTGCTWTGNLLALSNASVYSASLTESCSTGDTQLEGIATVNPAKTQLTIATTSSDQSKATALQMIKLNP